MPAVTEEVTGPGVNVTVTDITNVVTANGVLNSVQVPHGEIFISLTEAIDADKKFSFCFSDSSHIGALAPAPGIQLSRANNDTEFLVILPANTPPNRPVKVLSYQVTGTESSLASLPFQCDNKWTIAGDASAKLDFGLSVLNDSFQDVNVYLTLAPPGAVADIKCSPVQSGWSKPKQQLYWALPTFPYTGPDGKSVSNTRLTCDVTCQARVSPSPVSIRATGRVPSLLSGLKVASNSGGDIALASTVYQSKYQVQVGPV